MKTRAAAASQDSPTRRRMMSETQQHCKSLPNLGLEENHPCLKENK